MSRFVEGSYVYLSRPPRHAKYGKVVKHTSACLCAPRSAWTWLKIGYMFVNAQSAQEMLETCGHISKYLKMYGTIWTNTCKCQGIF